MSKTDVKTRITRCPHLDVVTQNPHEFKVTRTDKTENMSKTKWKVETMRKQMDTMWMSTFLCQFVWLPLTRYCFKWIWGWQVLWMKDKMREKDYAHINVESNLKVTEIEQESGKYMISSGRKMCNASDIRTYASKSLKFIKVKVMS